MVTRPYVYEPSKSFRKRITRRLTPFQARRMAQYKLDRPIVSFTFDDCPLSAIDNGVSKLDELGWKSTIYIASALLGTTNHHGLQMSETDVVAAHNAGHEIGEHSHSHIDVSEMSFERAVSDIRKNRNALHEMGLPPASTFAYPFGQTTREVKSRLGPDYTGLRGITPGPMIGKADLNQIRSTPLFTGKPFNDLLRQIEDLSGTNSWLTIFTHDIENRPTQWGCTPTEMEAIIAAVKASGAQVLTVADAIAKIKMSAP